MNIDDIYFAAINGDKERLISLLEADEVDINEPVDCGVNNGLHTTVPPLYSILSTMYQKHQRFNYEILDILIKYDININGFVEVYNDAFGRKIPLLCYAIRDWKSLELVNFFMQRGANPNIKQYESYTDGHNESYPLAYFAIMFWDDYRMLEIILGHGGDPNGHSLVYNHEQACSQYLPHIFHALISCKSPEKCICLSRFGMDMNTETIIGFGLIPKLSFKRYVSMVHNHLSNMLHSTYQQGRKYPLKPVHISRESFVIKKQKLNLTLPQEDQDKKSKARTFIIDDGLMPLRAYAAELIDYDNKTRKKYFAALDSSKIQPKKKADIMKINAANEYIDAVNEHRALMVRRINEVEKKITGKNQSRWWNTFNGLTHPLGVYAEIMMWMPFERFTDGPDGVQLISSCTATSSITGNQVSLLIKSGDVSPIYMAETTPDKVYSMAELCMWRIDDATEIKTTVTKTYTPDEIASELKSRSEGMDSMERFLNTISNKGNFTDDELYSFNQMSTNDYFNSKFNRDYRLSHYEDKLRNSKTTHVKVTNQNLYYQQYTPIGVIILDENGDAVAILIYNTPLHREIYTTDFNNSIISLEQKEYDWDIERIRRFAIRNLNLFPIEPVDELAEKPDYLSENEWYEFIYTCYIVFSKNALRGKILEKSNIAGEIKKNRISGTRLF